MPFLDKDGVKLYYEVHGSGTPLLLTHGYSATSEMWMDQIPAFSKGHRLIIWDMRGHGKSDYPEDQAAYSEAHTVADMLALLDALCAKGEKAVVGGLSLGGYMSLAFYSVHPERVARLLIIDTGPGFKKDSAREAWNKDAHTTAARLERDGLEALRSQSAERAMASHRNATGLALAARGMLAQHNAAVILSLPSVRVPTVVLVGSEDRPFHAASDYMTSKIPGAQKVVIPGAGHAANMDQPEAFNAAILRFLGDGAEVKARL